MNINPLQNFVAFTLLVITNVYKSILKSYQKLLHKTIVSFMAARGS